jgi:hypothetical protein
MPYYGRPTRSKTPSVMSVDLCDADSGDAWAGNRLPELGNRNSLIVKSPYLIPALSSGSGLAFAKI